MPASGAECPSAKVDEAVGWADRVLAAAHVASPRVDAELLLAHVLGVSRARWRSAGNLTPEQRSHYGELIGRRATREPLQYLTGTAPFRWLELAVGEGVFVPRPETELLVDWGLAWLWEHPGSVVVDLCAGSGAIAAAIATEAPESTVYAVEQAPAALIWLRRNVVSHGVTIVEGDATDPTILSSLDGRVDLVLSNPPYVPEIAAPQLPTEVRDHDPRDAVFAGVDGLAVIRPLIGRVAGLLRPGGAFGFEHDETHAYVAPTLVAVDGRFGEVALHHDLARRPRFTTATRT